MKMVEKNVNIAKEIFNRQINGNILDRRFVWIINRRTTKTIFRKQKKEVFVKTHIINNTDQPHPFTFVYDDYKIDMF